MKKLIVLFLFILASVFGKSQDIIGERGIFGSVYIGTNSSYGRYVDSLLNDTTGWIGKVRSFPTAHAIAQFVAGRVANSFTTGCQSKLLTPYSVVWAGADYDFSVSAGDYQIDCNLHFNSTTLIELPVADGTQDRIDVIYLGTDNAVHFISGDLAPPGFAVEPILASDQFKLVAIPVNAATTTPALTEEIIYDENTESTATGTGVTVNSADVSLAPYQGTFSTLIGTLTNNDLIIWIKVSGTWSTLGKDALQFFIKLGSPLPPTDNFRMTLWNGSIQVSLEVPIAINRNDVTNWQPVSIDLDAFGNLLNTNIDRVRIRTTIAATYTSQTQVDYIRLVDGVVNPPGNTNITTSEGVTSSGNDIMWFGEMDLPAQIFRDRSVNTHHQSIHFNNAENQTVIGGKVWQHGNKPFSPWQFESTDTLKANSIDPPTKEMPLSGIFARRTMYYNPSIFTTQKIYGHYLGMTWNFQDSMRFRNEQGDYNGAVIIESRIHPRGMGPQRTGSNGTGNNNLPYFSTPTLLVNTILSNSNGLFDGSTNTIHTYGWLSGVNSYLYTGSLDTVERFSFFQTNNFLTGNSRVKKLYGIDFQHNLNVASADSSWGLWDQYGYMHYLRGNTVFGYGSTSTTDKIKVFGNVNISDSVHIGKAHSLGATTGTNIMLRRTSDGAVMEIDPSLIGGGGSQSLNDVAVIGNESTVALRVVKTLGGAEAVSLGKTAGNQGRLLLEDANLFGTTTTYFMDSILYRDSALRFPNKSGTIALLSDVGGGGSGVTTVDPFETTGTADGLSILGTAIKLHAATTSLPGGVIIGGGLGVISGTAHWAATGRLNSGGTTFAGGPRINFIGTGIVVGNASGDLDVDFSGLVPTTGTIWNGIFGGTTRASGDATLNTVPHWVSENTAPATFTLPSLSGNGNRAYFIKNEGTDNVTVVRAGSDQIYTTSLVTSFTIPIGESRTIIASGAFWHVHGLPSAGGGLTQEQVEDFAAALFGTDNGDIDFEYTDGTPDVSAQIKAGAIVNADIGAGAAIDASKLAATTITDGFMVDRVVIGGKVSLWPQYIWYDEFQGSQTASIGTTFMFELASGTGANAAATTSAASIAGFTGDGAAELTMGTTTSGKAILHGGFGATNNNQMGDVDNDKYYRVEFKNVIINDLSDGTETYKIWFGFGIDNANTNAIWFTYSSTENSGVWNCVSYNNTTAETTSTATTVAADTEYDLQIEYYNQTAKFYLNGTLVATHTTQVPAAGGVMQAPIAKALKSAGTTSRVVYIDAVGLRITNENDL